MPKMLCCLRPSTSSSTWTPTPTSQCEPVTSWGSFFSTRKPTSGTGMILQSQLCVLTLIWCPFNPHVTAVAHKRPQSFCQKCRWQVTPKHAYAFDPLKLERADCATVQAQCGNLSEMSSHATRQGHSDSGLQSGISVRNLISNLKKKKKREKKAQVRNGLSKILPKSSQARKKSSPPPPQA